MVSCAHRKRRYLFFFFQAEDGIRDGRVTGVQTCALPILPTGRWCDGPQRTEERTRKCHARDLVHALRRNAQARGGDRYDRVRTTPTRQLQREPCSEGVAEDVHLVESPRVQIALQCVGERTDRWMPLDRCGFALTREIDCQHVKMRRE